MATNRRTNSTMSMEHPLLSLCITITTHTKQTRPFKGHTIISIRRKTLKPLRHHQQKPKHTGPKHKNPVTSKCIHLLRSSLLMLLLPSLLLLFVFFYIQLQALLFIALSFSDYILILSSFSCLLCSKTWAMKPPP